MMKLLVLILLIPAINCFAKYGDDLIEIDTADFVGNRSELIYLTRMEIAPKAFMTVEIGFWKGTYKRFGFAVLQVHSFYRNITIENHRDKTVQKGTNIGITLTPENHLRTFRLINPNHDEFLQCLIAFVIYMESSPVPSGCTNNTFYLNINETQNLVLAEVPTAREVLAGSCDAELSYETFYSYIEPFNFAADAYFDGIEQMLFKGTYKTFPTKQSTAKFHQFEKISGRALIINTVVKNSNGELAFYMPSITYSCPQNSWNSHCNDNNFLRQAISILLLIHAIVMMLNLLVPDLIEAILNGMLYGGLMTVIFMYSYHLDIHGFDYFITIIIGAFFIAAIFGTCALYFPVGRWMSKFTFACLLMTFIMESFFENVTSLYIQFMAALGISIGLFFIKITFSVFLGGLVLILNISYLLKIGNLHRIVICNFLSLTTLPLTGNETYFDFIRSNVINYDAPLLFVDFMLILFYLIVASILTIRKERYFFEHPTLLNSDIFHEGELIRDYNCDVARRRRENCIVGIDRRTGACSMLVSRCRRHHFFRSNVINERSPLISHWLTSDEGDDDVFESPESNSRYISRLSPESQERINAVQNFEDR